MSSWVSARTWTSKNGASIQAKYVSHNQDTVVIRRLLDFKEFKIPFSSLSDADQQWIQQTHPRNSTRSASDLSTSNKAEILPKKIVSLIEQKQGRLILEDNFNRDDPPESEQLGPLWTTNSEWAAQGKKQCDLIDGNVRMKTADTADTPVMLQHIFEQPLQDSVLWVRLRLLGSEHSYISFSDPNYNISEYGRICGITLTPGKVIFEDHKFGYYSPEATEMKRSRNQSEQLREHTAQFMQSTPAELQQGSIVEVLFITHQRKITVYLNGEEISSFSSEGIAHPTKQSLSFIATELEIDHLKLWDLTER